MLKSVASDVKRRPSPSPDQRKPKGFPARKSQTFKCSEIKVDSKLPPSPAAPLIGVLGATAFKRAHAYMVWAGAVCQAGGERSFVPHFVSYSTAKAGSLTTASGSPQPDRRLYPQPLISWLKHSFLPPKSCKCWPKVPWLRAACRLLQRPCKFFYFLQHFLFVINIFFDKSDEGTSDNSGIRPRCYHGADVFGS